MVRTDFQEFDKIILGIDPWTNIMGYGVLGLKGKSLHLVSIGVILLGKYEGHALKLKHIFERNIALIDQYNPDEVALESPFFGKNVQSMLKLGRAQGVAMAAALHRSIPIFEYAAMIKNLMQLETLPKEFDASDAMAVAVCHYFTGGSDSDAMGGKKTKYTGWKAFVTENPDKVK
jgi:crossover junction endodeoxyribonuclease RuvC